jgi:hypothetical protein
MGTIVEEKTIITTTQREKSIDENLVSLVSQTRKNLKMWKLLDDIENKEREIE